MATHPQTWIEREDAPPIIYRLKRLHAVGYVPKYHMLPMDPEYLSLVHVSRKRPVSSLTLCSDGLLFGDDKRPGASQLRISPVDSREFERFIRSTPAPTMWEKTELSRVKLIVWIVLGCIFTVILTISSIAVDYLERLIGWQ